MKAILIDPTAKTVETVIHSGDYKEIYTFIGADCFDAARLQGTGFPGDAVFVDDVGALDIDDDTTWFVLPGLNPHPIFGKGLLLGADKEGDSAEPSVSIDTIRQIIRFGKGVPERGLCHVLTQAYQFAQELERTEGVNPVNAALGIATA